MKESLVNIISALGWAQPDELWMQSYDSNFASTGERFGRWLLGPVGWVDDTPVYSIKELREIIGGPVLLGVIGGTGLSELQGLENRRVCRLNTPFGEPSSDLMVGIIEGHRVAILFRHGRGHWLLPSDVPYRANIFALRMLGVDQLIAFTACGSLKNYIAPGDVVLVDQFLDRTHGRASSFFGNGLVAHVSMADPVCAVRKGVILYASQTCKKKGKVHPGGTYVCIEGPTFSMRAESKYYHTMPEVDVIGMTAMPEAKLAREAGLCYVSVAMPCDYDSWHNEKEPVDGHMVQEVMGGFAELPMQLLRRYLQATDVNPCKCQSSLGNGAIHTNPKYLPTDVVQRYARLKMRLDLILDRRQLSSS